MAIRVKFDTANRPLPARLILATKGGNKIRELPINDVRFRESLTEGSEFSFNVYKNRCVGIDGQIDEEFWKRIVDFRLAYCPEFDQWYELDLDISESTEIIKAVQATSLGKAELSQINVYGMEVNTEEDIERVDYKPTILYDPNDATKSLIDRLLNKAPHYRVGHVDSSIANIQRTFQFDGKSIDDCFIEIAEEINCLFVENASKGEEENIDRFVSVYDLESSCMVCGYRGDFMAECPRCGATAIQPGYGEDTSVFVSRENLADEITYSTDADSVKNCFRLEAGDDLMTATIKSCNPNGSQYIWYFTQDMKDDMSDVLKAKLDQYDGLYDYYQNEYSFSPPSDLVTQYNEIVDRYDGINPDLHQIPSIITGYPELMEAYYDTIDMKLFLDSELMPNVEIETTTAAQEAAKLTMSNLVPVAVTSLESCTTSTASAAVLSVAQCLVRGTFQVKIDQASYNVSNHTWSGKFIVTNYGDEEDTATTPTVSLIITEDFETYLKRKIQKAMNQQSDDATDITSLFELPIIQFSLQLNNYSLQRLTAFRDACQVALNTLIQQGGADPSAWASAETDIYNTMYVPYLEKMTAIEGEMYLRSQQIAIADGAYDEKGGVTQVGMQRYLNRVREEIQDELDFEYYLGDACLREFSSFRREDSFSNPNYISDGLNNEEIFDAARDFIELAQKELYKSSRLQHSISSSLSNLLSIREFHPIIHHFGAGNWIRMKVDGEIYRLRIKEYSIDYDNWDLSVTFSDLKIGASSANDIEDLLSSMRSMTTSYGLVTRQARAGKRSQDMMDNWVAEGFKLTTKIVGGAENQEFLIDESGITGREYIPETEGYKPTQIKIISDGVYVTDDGWITARAGIGRFAFWNPQTQRAEEAYGVIADTIVGNIVLSEEVGIYNKNASITLDRNGFTLIAESEDNDKVFQIQRRERNGDLSNVLSIDSYGQLQLDAYSTTDEMNAAISVSASGIRTDVSQTLSSYSTTQEMNSAISQTASTIRTEVSTTLQNYSTTTQMNSIIDQTADAINLEVSKKVGASEIISKINQTAESITINASKINLSSYSTTSQMNSAITTSANAINLEVAKKVGASEIIAKINMSPESVTINANRLNLTGYVTISNLGANGTTTVDGGRIHGGTIKLGGSNNGNGTLQVVTANDVEFMLVDNSGITYTGIYSYRSGYGTGTTNPSGSYKYYKKRTKIEDGAIDFYTTLTWNSGAVTPNFTKRASLAVEGDYSVTLRTNTNDCGINLVSYNGARLTVGGSYDVDASQQMPASSIGLYSNTYAHGSLYFPTNVGTTYTSSTYARLYGSSSDSLRVQVTGGGTTNTYYFYANGKFDAYQLDAWYLNLKSSELRITTVDCDNLIVRNSKPRTVQTKDFGELLLYSYEMPSPMFGDIGESTIDEDGVAYIFIDPVFEETVDVDAKYQVFIQKYGDGECWISERNASYFVVCGDPGLSFAWEIKAKQFDASNKRMELKDLVVRKKEREPEYDKEAEDYINSIEHEDYGEDAAVYIKELEGGRIYS